MTEKTTETGKLWTAVDKVKERVSDLEGAVKYKIPDLEASIGDLKNDMKDGFEDIGEKLETERTKAETTKERGWKLTTGLLVTGMGILMTILARLIFAPN